MTKRSWASRCSTNCSKVTGHTFLSDREDTEEGMMLVSFPHRSIDSRPDKAWTSWISWCWFRLSNTWQMIAFVFCSKMSSYDDVFLTENCEIQSQQKQQPSLLLTDDPFSYYLCAKGKGQVASERPWPIHYMYQYTLPQDFKLSSQSQSTWSASKFPAIQICVPKSSTSNSLFIGSDFPCHLFMEKKKSSKRGTRTQSIQKIIFAAVVCSWLPMMLFPSGTSSSPNCSI